MECARGSRRWSGRSMLKLAALCFAMSICLCCVWSWGCSGSGRRGGAVLLRSGNESSKAASCAIFR
uniref:Uncharacterized protein n=1 Tax=Arundo donax TaxID=35708 RepID=A0A0A9CUF7_ARUDO